MYVCGTPAFEVLKVHAYFAQTLAGGRTYHKTTGILFQSLMRVITPSNPFGRRLSDIP